MNKLKMSAVFAVFTLLFLLSGCISASASVQTGKSASMPESKSVLPASNDSTYIIYTLKRPKRIAEQNPPVTKEEAPLPDEDKEPLPLLVNADNPLPEDYVPENLVNIGASPYKLKEEAAAACLELVDAAKQEGLKPLYILSGYRSYSSQKYLYDRKVSQLKSRYGARVYDVAATIVAKPGTSEHQTGLAVDISSEYCLRTSFGKTEEGKWLAENAHKFGFIIRYPADKTKITGVIYEPWHLRYVGTELAQSIFDSGLCLEEYIEEKK